MEIAQEFLVLGTALLPFFEARGAIPLGMLVFNLSAKKVLFWGILGNILVVPVVYFLLSILNSFFPKIFLWIWKFTQKRTKKINVLNLASLSLFVAIPLPFTGVWTGTALAFFLKIPFWIAFFSISFGAIMSALLVLFLTNLGIFLNQNFGIQGILSLVLFLIVIFTFLKKNEK
ncbi:small multi-drug export protein [Candidatus Parcubacteria bacterium]|nr:small multi-drug export protein [Candidatus Parcubacteria bacterium]